MYAQKGALFLSCVRKNNKLKIKEHNFYKKSICFEHGDCVYPLLRYFTSNQLDLIEVAFEIWTFDDKAHDFGLRFPDKNDRLIAIMRNIIDNKGTFKP